MAKKAPTNTEVEFRKINVEAERFASIIELVKYTLGCITFLVAIWLIFSGLEKILQNQSADGISAIAKVVQALNIGSILGYVFGAAATVAWKIERAGKKRAITEKNRYQLAAESEDNDRTSSGLNATGDTPKE